ncbi:TPA: hypothetical protein N2F56_003521 [Salmonella enterica]|nr:hypothetical protein [Salmonella enterica]HCL5083048.1 hypothetical protein [Salmonella enterica]
MSKFKGTPGPWYGKDVGICRQDDARLQLGFVTTSNENRRDECAANAHLIAAAPELLEALQLMVDAQVLPVYHQAIAKAAIAKALDK